MQNASQSSTCNNDNESNEFFDLSKEAHEN